MHNALKEIRPATANVPLNSPIKLQGEGALSYEIVCDFMETKTNFVKVDRAVAEKYLAHIEKGRAISEDMVDPVTGRVTLRIYQSYSTFSTIHIRRTFSVFKSSLGWGTRGRSDSSVPLTAKCPKCLTLVN